MTITTSKSSLLSLRRSAGLRRLRASPNKRMPLAQKQRRQTPAKFSRRLHWSHWSHRPAALWALWALGRWFSFGISRLWKAWKALDGTNLPAGLQAHRLQPRTTAMDICRSTNPWFQDAMNWRCWEKMIVTMRAACYNYIYMICVCNAGCLCSVHWVRWGLLKLALRLRALGPAVATGTSVKEREGTWLGTTTCRVGRSFFFFLKPLQVFLHISIRIFNVVSFLTQSRLSRLVSSSDLRVQVSLLPKNKNLRSPNWHYE